MTVSRPDNPSQGRCTFSLGSLTLFDACTENPLLTVNSSFGFTSYQQLFMLGCPPHPPTTECLTSREEISKSLLKATFVPVQQAHRSLYGSLL